MTIVFMATGDIALPTFRWLIDSEHEILALVTQPDRPAGRSMELRAPKVKELALEAKIPVLQPEKIGEIESELKSIAAELHVVMAYGQFLPRRIYGMAPRGCINLHASLLPKYRGASCIQGAIAAGDSQTGITIMHVVQTLDAGNIISSEAIEIGPDETGGELHDRLADLGPIALDAGLAKLASGEGEGKQQDESAMTYAPKLERADGELDWSLPASDLERLVRAYDPWPGTFTTFVDSRGKTKRLKVFPPTSMVESVSKHGVGSLSEPGVVVCGDGTALRLSTVQPEGKRVMQAEDFFRGVEVDRLGETPE